VTACLASLATAQSPDAAFLSAPYVTEKADLLQNESVQKEIKLRPEQLAALKKAARDWEEAHRIDVAKARAGTDLMKTMEVRRQALQDFHQHLRRVLTASQLGRLGQIHTQVQGVSVFLRPEVREHLGITPAQLSAMRPVIDEARRQTDTLMRSAGAQLGGRTPTPRQMDAMARNARRIQQGATARVMAELSAEQQKLWKDMVGEPFELRWGTARTGAAAPDKIRGGDSPNPR
jgi:hypothetical protein